MSLSPEDEARIRRIRRELVQVREILRRVESQQRVESQMLIKLAALYRIEQSKHQLGVVPQGCPLTVRQYQVVAMIAQGMTFEQIAEHTNRAVSTIHQHMMSARRRLKALNAPHAVHIMSRSGWL